MENERKWEIREFDEYLGYDCMTGGIRVGPVVLDGRDYGQQTCHPITDEAKSRMLADAKLISAAPDLLKACEMVIRNCAYDDIPNFLWDGLTDAILKAGGDI